MDRFLPPAVRSGGADDLRRGRLLLIALGMVLAVAVPTAALLWFMALIPEAQNVLLGVIPTLLIAPLLWSTGSVRFCAHALVLLIFIQIIYTTSDDNAFALPTLVSLPVIASAVAGRWHGVPWGLIIAGATIAIGLRYGAEETTLYGLCWVTAILAIALSIAIWIIEGSRERANGRAEAARAALELEHEHALELERYRSVGSLASTLAHDYSNLLMVISGFSETLPDSPNRHGIEKAVRSATQLTRRLLAYSSIAEQADRPAPAVQDLRQLLLDSSAGLQSRAGQHRTVRVDPGSAPNPAAIEPVQLEQMLLNLVGNAADASPEDGLIEIVLERIHIDEVEARALALTTGPYLQILVRDRGVGMSAEILARALEPFFTTKPPAEGSGLGLASTFAVARSLNGTLALNSTPGAGTTARLLLPAACTATRPAVPADQQVTADAPPLGSTDR